MIITEQQLQRIMPGLAADKRKIYLPFLNRVMEIFAINRPLRVAAFLAQLAHESGELRYMEEIWGPTTQQKRYEPPGKLAEQLGNTTPGDGWRYRGRGPIQITGRYNYKVYGEWLKIDLVSNPDLASTPQIAFSIAGLYWDRNKLNQLADKDDLRSITLKINGGLIGQASREKYYRVAKEVLLSPPPGAPEGGSRSLSRSPQAAGKKGAVKKPASKS